MHFTGSFDPRRETRSIDLSKIFTIHNNKVTDITTITR